jgi:transglutaminase-like putative cysteine protease
MHISVSHSTVYRYDGPVYLGPHTIRMRPRDDAAQRLTSFALEITPQPAGQSECLDQDGNVTVETWFDGPATELAVRSMFTIETLRENPFAFLMKNGMGELPPAYSESVAAAVSHYREETGLADTVRSFAAAAAEAAGGKTLDFLTVLNRRISSEFTYVTRHKGRPRPADVTLVERAGSCRDFAVLFVAACRAAGLAARFVSGYDLSAEHKDQSEMHAWAEVYLEGGGWRGYDPSSGLAVSTSHVAVAAAAEPALAAPVTGSYGGSAKAEMEFLIAAQAV